MELSEAKQLRVLEEIKKLLKENQIAGSVILYSPDRCDFLNHLTPEWTCASFLPNQAGFRFKTYAKDGKAKAKKQIENTLGMLESFGSTSAKNIHMFAKAYETLAEGFEVTHNKKKPNQGTNEN